MIVKQSWERRVVFMVAFWGGRNAESLKVDRRVVSMSVSSVVGAGADATDAAVVVLLLLL